MVRGADRPAGYVVGMLRNAEADRLRLDTERRVGFTPETFADFLPEGAYAEDTSWIVRALQRALAQLSEADRALYHEHYVERQSLGEIADRRGIKYAAAAGRHRRLKERMRALMKSRHQ